MLSPAPKLQAMFVYLTKSGSKKSRILKLDTGQRCVQPANLAAESQGGNSLFLQAGSRRVPHSLL
jgi:hypothetical protein